MTVTYDAISRAHERIKPFIHHTPILTSRIIDEQLGASLYFKCENFQKGGAFKARGAFNALHSLSAREIEKGIVTHSSGNHAAAVALACASRQVPAFIVMPSNATQSKKDAVKRYGGTIIECAPTLAAREQGARQILEQTGGLFLHPYDNDLVIAGQGTAAREMIADGPAFDMMMCPVGGGGLTAGTALSVRHLLPDARMVAGEPLGADDARQSFLAGKIIPQTNPQTIADGVRTSLGERNFALIQDNVDDILTATEENIIQAMRLIWQHMKIIIEPSSAVPLACLLAHKADSKGQKIGIILSGGNVDLDQLPW